ncbi:hypothetical protein BX661DRAFT_178770 [Kickxella alabastrina]|uniref:uncharacterized protein n=1 Tax=Kickxella alabastrina TaxID=61397 RepID=UPI00221FA890|nr:uncharacterized protein BX661DRAFT_178770 [Kickxella alabastrina]KAI7832912.1 hypothetical protein BX661DRAFT_178770 [Kickxella alabastrina]
MTELIKPSEPKLSPPSYNDVVIEISPEPRSNTRQAPSKQQTTIPNDTENPVELPTLQPSAIFPEPQHHPLDATVTTTATATNSNNISPPVSKFLASLMYKKSSQGYSSSDPRLNTDPEALLRFINECNDRPLITIEVVGSHTVRKEFQRVFTLENGQTRRETRTQVETVEDFRFYLDLTPYIHETGTLRITTGNDDEPMWDTPQQLLSDYTITGSALKKLRVNKKVTWDFAQMDNEIAALVHCIGYPHTVSVSFPTDNDRIVVRSHSRLTKVWLHPVTIFFCVVSCAWVVGLPIKRRAGKRWKNRLDSEFGVMVSPMEYISRNSALIYDMVPWAYRQMQVYPAPHV